GREVTYLEAISQALDEEMACDERVFLMGEDIGPYGGAFRITEGFQQKYGEWRVLDTPLSESGFVGAAIGAAMMGMRPVVEMQFADFISCAFDHKFLYRRIKAVLPDEDFIVPIGKADVKRAGVDVSVITYGAMVHLALEAAELLARDGIALEVVDLRTLIPLDKEAIYQSVRKTGKVITLHEDNKTGGIGAEVAALLAEECFDSLDGPIMRIAAPDTPVPFSTPLEEFFLPKVSDIVAAAKKLAAY